MIVASDGYRLRFCNMDYIFMSSIVGVYLLTLIASYDIACQWLKKLWQRMHTLPQHLHPTISPSNFYVKIPKFHFDAHGKKNHAQYAFGYTWGVGRVDGEGIERLWAMLKAAASQTIEMGPGARRDTLDDFCGFSNWRKVVGIGTDGVIVYFSNVTDTCLIGNTLLKKLVDALPEAMNHQRAFTEFDKHLRADRAEEVAQWEKEYEEWDKEPKNSPCIFDTTEPSKWIRS